MSEESSPFVRKGHHMTKAFGDLRFRFIPCGFKARDFDTIVYVRYKPLKEQYFDNKPLLIDAGVDFAHFDFPDRELLFSRQARMVDGDRPFNRRGHKNWDKAVVLSLASRVGDDLPFDRYMINPHAFTPNTEPRVRENHTMPTTDKIVFADSGGFQLGHGGSSFIHPNDVVGFYTRNADEGMVLDVPARAVGDSEILKYTARVQNLNTKYMKERLSKDFRLAIVVHGLSLDRVDQYRRDTENFDHDFEIASISGSLRFNIMESIHRILHIILTGNRYKQYHVLGVSNPPFYAALIRLAYVLKQQGINVLLTADSSSPIAFGLKHTYYQQRVFHEGLVPTRYGIKMSSNADAPAALVSNPHRKFGSSDILSQIIGGYQDVISSYNTTFTQAYAMYMNQIELARYSNQMCVYADTLDSKTYKQLVKEQYRSSMHAHLLASTLDYIEYYAQHGIEKAFKKFSYYMPNFSADAGLHSFPAMESSEEMLEEQRNFQMTKKRLVRVLKGYFEFHKNGTIPEAFGPAVVKKAPALKLKI